MNMLEADVSLIYAKYALIYFDILFHQIAMSYVESDTGKCTRKTLYHSGLGILSPWCVSIMVTLDTSFNLSGSIFMIHEINAFTVIQNNGFRGVEQPFCRDCISDIYITIYSSSKLTVMK
ncbi:hypothetical protein I79_016361 [Cricetulus griseus]|uniref:Uncharacterized protein n=1 Tax=Cricetulus griseus TaxID=10029 RepID=G3HZ66_CRIGR|nr:hypothetical protein I79_016361 [Cricetulus griseus]